MITKNQEKQKQYKITVSESQLRVVSEALDFYSRIQCGQLDELLNVLCGPHSKMRLEPYEMRKLLDFAKSMLFSLDAGESLGIGGPHTPESAKVAYEIYKVIEHKRWTDDPDRYSVSVHSSGPLRITDEPLAIIEGGTKCISEEAVLLTQPPQYKCKVCGQTWVVGNEVPECKITQEENE